jgi:DinB superfamily
MFKTAENIRKTLKYVLPLLQNITDEEAAIRPLPNKWTKKEILGHLIDSACNNQQKFVRTIAQKHTDFGGYQQNHWVESQKYNEANWNDLINFWHSYNLHIARIIENVSPDVLGNTINIEGAGTFTLKFIMEDYGEHLKHHLKQILPMADLENKFQNIYNT